MATRPGGARASARRAGQPASGYDMIRSLHPLRTDRMQRFSRTAAPPPSMTSAPRPRARRWALALLLALAAYAGTAGAQDPNSAQGRQQAHAAEVNRQGWLQQQAELAPTSEELAAQQATYEAIGQRDASVRRQQQRDWWGVVVVNTADGSWNIALDGDSQDGTLQQALKECGSACRPAVAFANTCLAPAYSAQRGLFWAQGDDKKKAREAATQKCTAAGGRDCTSREDQVACTGWKYAYSLMDRINERLNFVAIGRSGRPQVEFYPGLEAYMATPPEARGKLPASASASAPAPAPGRAAGDGNTDQPWTAIAVPRGGGQGVGLHLGANRQDAIDNAVRKCGAPNCETLLAFTKGQCAAAVISPVANGAQTFGAVGESKQGAAQEATAACTKKGETNCLTVFNQCM
ncbi:DUF4189 domain-containing protein [Stenotrophomonas sp. MMGLT7]|uniref:DUF4189 domain-containing protein n=1 Tax=Stenotrophomonas sp. MMGLT7 TaxID=2901227 RepID=UPI001E5271C6|nr:DUF4189 domain-containing protein [Stenotrophomonas sp. MMGLT7]MCD7099627.1 DUF4189 domain-containing protein [Stenotrophomonas sp. MMGLT7]